MSVYFWPMCLAVNANHGEDLFVQRAVLSIERIIDTNIATIRQNVGHVNPKNGERPFAQIWVKSQSWINYAALGI